MSNLETAPDERICEAERGREGIEVLEPRDVPLGGPRAMNVRRTLPQRQRSLIGAWCFLDHYGPDAAHDRTMDVPPHPHTGLQTVSWLFSGEIEHRDSTGAHQHVRPGELNLMTAGAGIQHSEVSIGTGEPLHGVQLWTALPESARHAAPFFEHVVPPVAEHQGGRVSVFLGELLGMRSTATTFTPLVGAQLDLPPGAEVTLPVDPTFEHGVLVDAGEVAVDEVAVPTGCLAYRAPGADTLALNAGRSGARVLLIGGEPFEEQIVMWWNFVGRSHDEIVTARGQWMREVIGGETPAGRFGRVDGYTGADHLPGRALPAPELPGVRLVPRQQPPR